MSKNTTALIGIILVIGLLGLVVFSVRLSTPASNVNLPPQTTTYKDFSDLPIVSAAVFFTEPKLTKAVTVQSNIKARVPIQANVCMYDLATGFSPTPSTCQTSQANIVMLTQFWGPGESSDTHLGQIDGTLDFLLGDSLIEYRDNQGNFPMTAKAIRGYIGDSEILGIVSDGRVSIVLRQGKKTIGLSTSSWQQAGVPELFGSIVHSIALPI